LVKEKIKEEPLTLGEVKEILENRSKEGELNYIQRVTLDYTNRHVYLPADKSRNLLNELISLGVNEKIATQIVDCMPEHKEELMMFFSKEIRSLDPNLLNEVEKKLKEYRKEIK